MSNLKFSDNSNYQSNKRVLERFKPNVESNKLFVEKVCKALEVLVSNKEAITIANVSKISGIPEVYLYRNQRIKNMIFDKADSICNSEIEQAISRLKSSGLPVDVSYLHKETGISKVFLNKSSFVKEHIADKNQSFRDKNLTIKESKVIDYINLCINNNAVTTINKIVKVTGVSRKFMFSNAAIKELLEKNSNIFKLDMPKKKVLKKLSFSDEFILSIIFELSKKGVDVNFKAIADVLGINPSELYRKEVLKKAIKKEQSLVLKRREELLVQNILEHIELMKSSSKVVTFSSVSREMKIPKRVLIENLQVRVAIES